MVAKFALFLFASHPTHAPFSPSSVEKITIFERILRSLRPSFSMRFADVIGQQAVKERLLAMSAEGRIPHAMLFMGAEGVGALPLALALAQYIDCTGDKSNGDSCGQCPACQKNARLVHPDVHYIFPIAKNSQGDDTDTYLPEWRQLVTRSPYFGQPEWTAAMSAHKASSPKASDDDSASAPTAGKQALIAKDAAQAIHAKLSMKPYEADKQIMIVWKPELMNETTSNSLLKILEEPPTDTIFIMVSEDPQKILPTIMSRTQTFRIPPIDEASLQSAISRMAGIVGDDAKRVAHIAQGSFVAAMRQISHSDADAANLATFQEMMRAAWAGNVIKMNNVAETCRAMSREQVKAYLEYCQRMIRESFVLNLATQKLNFLTQPEEEFLVKFAPFIHVGNVERLSALIDDTAARIEQNGNVRMVMKSMILSLTALIRRAKRPTSES